MASLSKLKPGLQTLWRLSHHYRKSPYLKKENETFRFSISNEYSHPGSKKLDGRLLEIAFMSKNDFQQNSTFYSK